VADRGLARGEGAIGAFGVPRAEKHSRRLVMPMTRLRGERSGRPRGSMAGPNGGEASGPLNVGTSLSVAAS